MCAAIGSNRGQVSAQQLAEGYSDLGWPRNAAECQPVVYSPLYNVSFAGLEKLHPFDACKFKKIVHTLTRRGVIKGTIPAVEATPALLADVHSAVYLQALSSSSAKVAAVVELPPLRFLPVPLLRRFLLRNMRHHVGGTMLAVAIAALRGYAINVGGGMHHAYHSDGMGWCPYADITLAVRRLRAVSRGAVQRVLIVDTDAHQGNGHARDKVHFVDADTFIVDLYNAGVFPKDEAARRGIDVEVRLASGCDSQQYLAALRAALDEAFGRFQPDLVIHNAGSDVLDGDPLGRMCVSAEAVVERDSLVWTACRSRGIPVCMLLSGGYARNSAAVVSQSLERILLQEQSPRQQ